MNTQYWATVQTKEEQETAAKALDKCYEILVKRHREKVAAGHVYEETEETRQLVREVMWAYWKRREDKVTAVITPEDEVAFEAFYQGLQNR